MFDCVDLGREAATAAVERGGASRESLATRTANADRAVVAARMIRQLSNNSARYMSADAQRDMRNLVGHSMDEDESAGGGSQRAAHRGRGDSVESIIGVAPDAAELQRLRRVQNYCTRFIVTADRAGHLRVYARTGNTDLDRAPAKSEKAGAH